MARNLPVWSPFRETENFRRGLDDVFDQVLGNWRPTQPGRAATGPAIESYVDNGTLVLRADLPGVDPKDVEITVSGDSLVLRGKRESRQEKKGRDYFYREVSYGTFERTVPLPKGIKPEEIKATYNNGVLELTMPTPKELSPRKIPVTIERGDK